MFWKTFWLSTFPLVAAAAAIATVPEPAPALDPEVLRVRELAWRAWFAGDEKTLREILPADFLGINMAEPRVVGREVVVEQALDFARSGGRLVELGFPETRAQRYGDVTVFYGRFRVVFVPGGDGAKEVTVEGRLTEMFLWQDGRWLHTGWHLDTVGGP